MKDILTYFNNFQFLHHNLLLSLVDTIYSFKPRKPRKQENLGNKENQNILGSVWQCVIWVICCHIAYYGMWWHKVLLTPMGVLAQPAELILENGFKNLNFRPPPKYMFYPSYVVAIQYFVTRIICFIMVITCFDETITSFVMAIT